MNDAQPSCGVDDVIITGELDRRPSRAPDYEAENRALTALADMLARSPDDVLQRLTDLMLELDLGDSAGISLAEGEGAGRIFRWVALSGDWGHFKGGTMPFSASPCGVAVTRHEVMLFQHPERAFPDANVDPLIKEILLVPFAINGDAIGTVWANAHSDHRTFNREDARFLKSLSRFASAAHQMVAALGDARVGQKESLAALEIELRARRESEGRYRTLFESMDEGFCTIEVIFDASNKPLDYRFLEINPAFERHTGLVDAEGKRMRDLRPNHEEHWFEIYGRIALTGEPERFENEAAALGRWYDVYAFRIGEPDEHRVAILFRDITQRKKADERLRESEQRLMTELSGSRLLQRLSTRLIPEQSPEALYDQILDTALQLMRADAVSIQLLDDDGKRLRRVATRNLHPDSTEYWTWVDASHASTCGQALSKNERVVVEDVEASPELVGTGDLEAFRASGTRAVQSTPLLTRAGKPIGMISTHWRTPRRLDESHYGPFDVFARQVADLLERSKTESALQQSEERQIFLLKLSDALRPLGEPEAIKLTAAQLLGRHIGANRVAYAENVDDKYYEISGNYVDGAREIVGRARYADYGPGIDDDMQAGRNRLWPDIPNHPILKDSEKRALAEAEVGALLNVPLVKDGRLVAFLGINYVTAHDFQPLEIELVTDVAERTWAAVERARVEAALRASERHANLLLAELQHRVRNTLAVVRSIARRTAENSSSIEDMMAHFQGRLDAFSRVQAALTRSPDGTVGLTSLIEDELVAHAARDGEQISIDGPHIALEPKVAERMSLAIHELTTNAVKHGALVNGKGSVRVRWRKEGRQGDERLVLKWTESGVPIRDCKPKREGFGMELLCRSLPYDLQAQTELKLTPRGLRFELNMPLSTPDSRD